MGVLILAKIKAPNREYNGISAGVTFINGVGETSDPFIIGWFKERGYEVEEPKEAQEPEVEKDDPEDPPRARVARHRKKRDS